MPAHSYTLVSRDAYNRTYNSFSFSHSWERSPRVNGKLVLRPNPWNLSTNQVSYRVGRTDTTMAMLGPYLPIVESNARIQRAMAISETEVRASFLRAARNKDPAGGLGVAIATAGQSIAMLRNSAARLVGVIEAATRFYYTAMGRRRLKRLRRLVSRGGQPTAGLVLEGFFGWGSALSDFQAAAATLANPWPRGWVSTRKSWKCQGNWSEAFAPPIGTATGKWTATGHCTYAGGIRIDNPNLWLANRMGLLNPFVVAWDLVPWSFLVNMVSNMGQVLGSLTDLAGISLVGGSLTTGMTIDQGGFQRVRTGTKVSFCEAKSITRSRRRALGSLPTVTPYLRFPGWEVGTAAIVGSLLVQNCDKLVKVLS